MNRRGFIIVTTCVVGGLLVKLKLDENEDKKPWVVIESVLNILFPKTDTMPGAREFNSTQFLIQNSKHSSFNQKDLSLILKGADDFNSLYPSFVNFNQEKQQKILEKISQNDYGKEWLSILIYYGIEAMLSDPIYNGNPNGACWKKLNHIAGKPQPKYTYAQII